MARSTQAIFFILAGMAVVGLIDNFMRFLTPTGSLWQFHVLRAAVSLLGIGVIAAVWKVKAQPLSWGHVAVRSGLMAVSMLVYFACLAILPITQVVAGLFTAPLFVVLYERVLFGQAIEGRKMLAVALGFGGIVIGLGLAQGGVDGKMVLPVLAGALYGGANLYTSRACRAERTMALMAGYSVALGGFGLLGCLALGLAPWPEVSGPEGFVWRGWQALDAVLVGVVLFHGLGALLGLGLATRAYMIGDASTISVFENALLIFSAIFAFFLFGEMPDGKMLIGMAMILGAGVLVATAPAPKTQEA